eukprot:SAG22_NODE_155_length_17123_cov_37.528489_18_plen_102_part_00
MLVSWTATAGEKMICYASFNTAFVGGNLLTLTKVRSFVVEPQAKAAQRCSPFSLHCAAALPLFPAVFLCCCSAVFVPLPALTQRLPFVRSFAAVSFRSVRG